MYKGHSCLLFPSMNQRLQDQKLKERARDSGILYLYPPTKHPRCITTLLRRCTTLRPRRRKHFPLCIDSRTISEYVFSAPSAQQAFTLPTILRRKNSYTSNHL